MSEIKSTQLHHFSDETQHSYGAVSYIRMEDVSGNVKCSFFMGKSKLAPIKPITIPRMELSAAVVSTRLEKMCRKELSLPVNQSFFWTDRTCVLRYVKNTDKRFQTFVANRIATIHDASSPTQWHYVDTHYNPADDASRGVAASSLQRWIEGPDFLTKSPEEWLKRPEELSTVIPDHDPEIKGSPLVYATNVSKVSDKKFLEQFIERFSSWSRLKRVFGWILCYIGNLCSLCQHRKQDQLDFQSSTEIPPISFTELVKTEIEIIKLVQETSFDDELRHLQGNNRKNSVRNTSCIATLDPIVVDGLIRVGGCLQRAQIDCDARHPVILPKTHHVVNLITNFYHHVSGHSGVEHTLSLIGEKYWIIKGRSTVRRILDNCVSCRKLQAPAVEQKMASLPEDRTTHGKPPFSYTGVDCFGLFEVRRARTKVKRYGVIFTCLTTGAVHIEVAYSLDTESFINALRRFVARRSQPEVMRSDNGGDFVKGEGELREEINNWNQTKIQDFLVQRNVVWIFNPPAGSHHGGVWERCVRTVRKVMKSVTKEQSLEDEGLSTLMCEVEDIVNGRPLTKLSDDPQNLEPLTPNPCFSYEVVQSCHLRSSQRKTAIVPNDGVKFSIWRTCFGGDGLRNIYHHYKKGRNG